MLDAPVWVRGEVVGVLCHEHIGAPRDWSAEEIDFVSALAAMVSLAGKMEFKAASFAKPASNAKRIPTESRSKRNSL